MTTLAPDVAVGDRYTLLERIAVGGMGEVWRARDELLGRNVALKVLKEEYAADPTFLQRFRNEAKHTAALSHPGIANVFDYGEVGATAYLVMELVVGEPLSSVLAREGSLSPERTLDVVGQAALALQAAHDAGVIHRDVKPGNLLIRPDGVVKVTDFGIARAIGDSPVTQTGLLVGTAAYVSPEQAAGRPVTAASDIYALGVVAYECLAGQRPFIGASPIDVATAHVHRPPPPLPESVPALVAAFVEQSLDKDPARRQANAGEFGRTALALAAELRAPVPATTVTPPPTRTLLTTDVAAGEPVSGPAARDVDAERRRVRNVFVAIGVSVVVLGFLLLRACTSNDSYVTMPKVVGDRYPDAAAELRGRGLDVERRTVADGAARGTVLRQSVPRGDRVPTGETVTLTVSAGPPTVTLAAADYLGRPFAEVEAALVAKGLQVSVRFGPGDGHPGTVTAVEPTGPVEEGSTVTVTVAGELDGPPDEHGHGKAKGHDD